MPDGFVQVAPDSTGKKIDNTELTVGANTVERQRINIADPTSATQIATVTAGNALKVDGSAVTQPVSGTVTTTPPANASENLNQVGGAAITLGQKAAASSIPVVLDSDTDRGQKTMANSLPVAIASDQSGVPVTNANLDVALSTRLKPADTLTAVTTVGTITNPVTANGDVDHDAINTLKNIQVAGNARAVDDPPTAVSATGDRAREWVDRYGSPVIRLRKIRETYTAVCRLAEAAARLDQTFTHTANTNKQWATLHHTVAASTKEVRLQSCVVWVTNMTTVAPQGIIELRQISAAPATGNPAITPTPHRRGGTAAEAVCLYLPTTAGTEANVNSPLGHHVFDEAVSVATNAFAHPQGYGRGGIVLYDGSLEDDEMMVPVLPVGTLDGWAVVSRLTGATVMRATVVFKFTEEIP